MEKSESFESLHCDGAEETGLEDPGRTQERESLIKRIQDLCGKDRGSRKPLNVLLVGTVGAGRSAFINTLAAALSGDRWRECAYYGSHGPFGGADFTIFTASYPKCCNVEKYKEILLPTLIDFPGFGDNVGEEITELLRILFYGHLPEGSSLAEAYEYYRTYGLEQLRVKYSQNDEKLKADRVIFVASAVESVPKGLISCVLQAARPAGTEYNPKKRTIPLYGVMTHLDKLEEWSEDGRRRPLDMEEYRKREQSFLNALGLSGATHRFLLCSNYCDDVDKDLRRVDTVFPDLDIPVLRFFAQVVDPVHMVLHDEERYGSEEKEEEGIGARFMKPS